MKSKASIGSHPLHPILIAFPIAFFTGAFLFDLAGLILDKAALHQTGYYLVMAGIAGAVMAAVPGIIDYFKTVPPKSSAKKRATQHALINTVNLLLFAGVLLYRRDEGASSTVIVVLEAVGVVLLSVAGWLGGTLVYRNQIGVDPRYADAGKWNELYLDQESGELDVASADELKVNQMKLVHAGKKRIVIGRTESGYVAFDDRCTHRGGSLAGGAMICSTVQCPWHGSQFDVTTGMVKAGPSAERINVYPVSEKNGRIFLNV